MLRANRWGGWMADQGEGGEEAELRRKEYTSFCLAYRQHLLNKQKKSYWINKVFAWIFFFFAISYFILVLKKEEGFFFFNYTSLKFKVFFFLLRLKRLFTCFNIELYVQHDLLYRLNSTDTIQQQTKHWIFNFDQYKWIVAVL